MSRLIVSQWLFCLLALNSVCSAPGLAAAEPAAPIATGVGKVAKEPTAAPDQPLANFELRDFHNYRVTLKDFADKPLVVLAFLGVECPLAKLYGPRLEKIANEYRSKGVVVLGIDSNSQDSIAELAAYARVHNIEFPLLKDSTGAVADRLGATRVTEVFVLDKKRIVRYQGRIDDQYGIGSTRPEPKQNELRAALDELLAGKAVSQPRSKAAGCLIGRSREPDEASPVTYVGQIAALLERRCVECHRPGQIGPFSLTDYDEIAGWSDMIGEVVAAERMPPWHANPLVGHFVGDRRLSNDEKQLFKTWVAAGAPRGSVAVTSTPAQPSGDTPNKTEDKAIAASEPASDDNEHSIDDGDETNIDDADENNGGKARSSATPKPSTGATPTPAAATPAAANRSLWALEREPDAVIAMRATPFKVSAQGVVDYKFFKVATNFKEDRWIKAAEVLPGNRAVVHHVVVHAFDKNFRDAVNEGATDGFLAAYVPGMRPATYPPGMAKLLPAGSQLMFQVHYVPNGSDQLDCSQLGLIFADDADVKFEVLTSAVKNRSLAIPAGAADYSVTAESVPAPTDCQLLCMMPHMHLRGSAFSFELLLPNGTTAPLLDVPHYDFNWQTAYRLVEPRKLAAGCRLRCSAHFDNSPANANNPDPKKKVYWGSQSKQEMMVGYFDVAFPRSADEPWRSKLAIPTGRVKPAPRR